MQALIAEIPRLHASAPAGRKRLILLSDERSQDILTWHGAVNPAINRIQPVVAEHIILVFAAQD
jgi:hypothetical protein